MPITCSSDRPVLLGQCLQLSKSDENVLLRRLSQRILYLSSLLRKSGAMILPSWSCYWAKAISAECSRSGRTLGGQRMGLLIWVWCWITATLADLWAFSSILSISYQLRRHCEPSLLKENGFCLSEKPLWNHGSRCAVKKKILLLDHHLKLHILIWSWLISIK